MATRAVLVPFALTLFSLSACEKDRLHHLDECEVEASQGVQESCASPGNPLVGECHAGVYRCVDGKKDRTVCSGETLPRPETCNGLDDDCDGLVDDVRPETDARVGIACGTDVVPPDKVGIGVCALGHTACASGAIVCAGAVGPSPETCNGLDDDCDGLIDDGSNLFELCQSADNPRLVGECRPGIVSCVNGRMDRTHCVGEVKPTAETCDGKDNDCDGRTDQGCGVSIACPADATVAVATLVSLTATGTSASGAAVSYSWTAIAGPPGGIGTPNQWDPDPPTASTEAFLPMIAGVYVIRVTATDATGAAAVCETKVTAVSFGLRVELTWDGSADMDLHVHDAAATPWFAGPDDCFYADRTPDWDVLGAAADDPALDIDNVSAFGPENVRIRAPVPGETYTVAVHGYARADGRTATVRVYCGSTTVPQATYASRPFSGNAGGNCAANEFWKVAAVTFDASGACVIAPIGDWSTGAARCQSF